MKRAWSWLASACLGLTFSAAAQLPDADAPVAVKIEALPLGIAQSPVGRERVWSHWELNQWAVELRIRQQRLPEALAPLVESEDKVSLEQALIARGVLTTPHDWPAGCSSFAEGLQQAIDRPMVPRAVEEWLDWVGVFRISCASEKAHGYEQALEAGLSTQLDRLDGWWTTAFSKAVTRQDVLATFLAKPTPEVQACLEQALPEALRQGLDRHEGLRHMANSCKVSTEALFGRAARCHECGPHPRRRMSRITEALVGLPPVAGGPSG